MSDRQEEFQPTGRLEDQPLAVLLIRIFREMLSGMLHVESQEKKTWLYFSEGKPAGVHIPNSEIYLGMVMRELGIVSDADFNESLMKMAETNKLQGQVLLEMGKVTTEQLERALEVQQLRKASQLFSIREGTYRFDRDASMPERMVSHPVHPFSVIYHGIRNCYEEEDLDRHLSQLSGKLCGAGQQLGKFKHLLQVPEDEEADLELLAQHRTPEDFANRARCGQTAARMLLLALHWCDLLIASDPAEEEPEPAPRPAEKAAEPRKAAPARARPAGPGQKIPAALRERVNEKYRQASKGNLLSLLEVSTDADPAQIKKSYSNLAKVYHPDRFARFDDAEISRQVEMISSRLNEAFGTLSDPKTRSDYLNRLVGEKERPISLNPEAAKTAYQKAKIFLKMKNNVKALESLRLASRLDPSEAAYQARLVWQEFLCDQGRDEEDRKRKVRLDLQRLHKQTPESFWVNRHLAMISNQLGEAADYEKYMRRAQNVRPGDIDNNRELRLLQSRREKKKEGLFGLKKS